MNDLNPRAVLLVAFTTVIGALFEVTLIGLAVGLGLVMLGTLAGEWRR